MAIAEALVQLEETKTTKKQAGDAMHARAILKKISRELSEAITEIDGIVAAGSFDTIGVDLKAFLNTGRGIVDTANTAFQDADMQAILT